MKILRFLLINVVALFLLLALIAGLLPSQVRISRAVDIDAPKEITLRKISRAGEWKEWNEFVKPLADVRTSPGGISSHALHVSLSQEAGDTVHMKWEHENGRAFTGAFALAGDENMTTVQWYFDFQFRWYPWEKFSSIVYDQQLGPQMEQSLSNLKRSLEKAP